MNIFEDKLNVCRQTGTGMQFHSIDILLALFWERCICAFIVYVGNSGFSWVFAIFRFRWTIKSIMQFVDKKGQTVYKIRPLVEYAAFFWDPWQRGF